jgi:beta-phosphoglucomutase
VIFDLDGVLAISEPLLAEAAAAFFAEKGHRLTAEDFRPFIGMGEDRYLGGPAEARDIPMDLPRDKARLYEIYQQVIRGRLQALPGAREFVQECRRRGLAIAVASGADRTKVVANLQEIGMPEAIFDTVVDGTQVVHTPDECLVVEDAVSGVAAARAAGMRCLGLTSSFSADELSGADWIATDLAHAPKEALAW